MRKIFLIAFFTALLVSCEKGKIIFDSTSAPDPIILNPQCEACHNGTFPEHSTNAHSKHTSGLYNFDCSVCHFEHGFETSTHFNTEKDVTFDPNGLATRNGLDTITPVWDTVTKTCSNIYCHSNGVTADRGSDSTYTWSTPPFGTPVYHTTPSWENGEINECTFCHNGFGNMTSSYMIERPNTMSTENYPASGGHQLPFHMDNNQDFSTDTYASPIWDGTQCFWCHTDEAIDIESVDGPILQGTYGTKYHVDGETFFIPASVSEGGTMANGMSYSSNGSAGHCGSGVTCW